MIDFQLISKPGQPPVYFQQLPVNTVSVYWIVFVGSADDDLAGGHGIYHWFEHLPSRGTEKYPDGYWDTEARLVRHGGGADAETGHAHTAFSADIPKRVWAEATDILADMIARPLLRTEDIQAEREIILQEIDEWHSAPYSHSLCELPGILWPGHPLGHDQLGTEETLRKIDPDSLKRAHELGYSRDRCTVFVAGDLTEQEVLDVLGPCIERLPVSSIPPRDRPANYGPLPPWQSGHVSEVETAHDDSVVYLLFPIPPWRDNIDGILRWDLLEDVFSAGDLGSPLNRMIREDSQLAYSPGFISTTYPDGGYAGLVAQTSNEPQRVLDAFWKLIRSDMVRSADWLDYVRDTIRGTIEMHDPDAGDYTQEASASLIHYGRFIPDDQYAATMLGYGDTEIAAALGQMTEDRAHAIVFRGRNHEA